MAFKFSMTMAGVAMLAMFVATAMFIIERGAPGQAWVAYVGLSGMAVGAGSVVLMVIVSVVSIWFE